MNRGGQIKIPLLAHRTREKWGTRGSLQFGGYIVVQGEIFRIGLNEAAAILHRSRTIPVLKVQ